MMPDQVNFPCFRLQGLLAGGQQGARSAASGAGGLAPAERRGRARHFSRSASLR
jgi:hypothetical protein